MEGTDLTSKGEKSELLSEAYGTDENNPFSDHRNI